MFVISITVQRYVQSDCKAHINLDPTNLPSHPRYKAVCWGRYLLEILNLMILTLYIYTRIVTRSHKHCCCGMAVSIKYSGRMLYLSDMKIAYFP